MLPIKLSKPLVIFDIEATGISPRADHIIELAAIRLNPDGTQEERCWLLNPGVPIPPETTAIHGITDQDVAEMPLFGERALEILAFFADADLSGFNAMRYDIPMLAEEFTRAGINFSPETRRVLDAQRIYHMREPRDLSAALQFYCGREHTGAHGAEADTRATLEVLKGQFERYTDLPREIEELDRLFNPTDPFNVDRAGRLRWVNGEVTINFGKRKGELLRELAVKEPSYVRWIIRGDFPQDVRAICEGALEGEFPEAPAFVKKG